MVFIAFPMNTLIILMFETPKKKLIIGETNTFDELFWRNTEKGFFYNQIIRFFVIRITIGSLVMNE